MAVSDRASEKLKGSRVTAIYKVAALALISTLWPQVTAAAVKVPAWNQGGSGLRLGCVSSGAGAGFSRTSNCPCSESLKPHRENPGENTWCSPVLAGLDFSGSYVDLSGIEKLQREGQGSR